MTGAEQHDSHSPKRARILFVCPEANFSRTISRVLDRCGYAIEVVDTGEQALERVCGEPFDAVVTEMHLPGRVCGVTLLGELRARDRDTPFLILTEGETTRLRRALEGSDAVVSLRKDADLDALKGALETCLAGRLSSPTRAGAIRRP